MVETGLVDEYRLLVHPVVLGTGQSIFAAPLALDPVSATVFGAGFVAQVFTPRLRPNLTEPDRT